MSHRDRYTEHRPPPRSEIRDSFGRHVGQAATTESQLRAWVAQARRLGVIMFLQVDLERMPPFERTVIEGAARQLYDRR